MADNLFTQMQKTALDAWKRSLEDSLSRVNTLYGRVGDVENQTQTQFTTAIDEWARLVKETAKYQTELAAEWRRQTLDTAQRFGATFPFATKSATPTKTTES